jgi:hypothetical protein
MGETLTALAVGPVAVTPERQRQGIGGSLLRYGHELGKREGFACAFLQGHPTYYPRLGYRPCYGFSKTTINTDKLPNPSRKFLRLPVRRADIPWLVERWEIEWRDVDFGWLWGTAPGEWAIPGIDTEMWWTEDGHRAAYTIGDKLIIAENRAWAREVIATLKPKQLDHHPSGWLAQHVLDAEWATVEVNRSDAAMMCELRKGLLEAVLKALESEERLPRRHRVPPAVYGMLRAKAECSSNEVLKKAGAPSVLAKTGRASKEAGVGPFSEFMRFPVSASARFSPQAFQSRDTPGRWR